jgi:hypothetical protein
VEALPGGTAISSLLPLIEAMISEAIAKLLPSVIAATVEAVAKQLLPLMKQPSAEFDVGTDSSLDLTRPKPRRKRTRPSNSQRPHVPFSSDMLDAVRQIADPVATSDLSLPTSSSLPASSVEEDIFSDASDSAVEAETCEAPPSSIRAALQRIWPVRSTS